MRISVLAVLVVAPGITTAVLDQNAWPLVKRAIESDAKTTYTCIREWTSWGGKETVQVRRDQASSGANRVFVLSPIHQQGFTIVDNARQRLTYNPDKGELTIQDSPLKVLSANDSSRRFRLLERNYKVEREAAESVAGRNAVRVRLQPIAKEFLFGRRYWIDKDKAVLLRVEWSSPQGERQIVSNTISIQFPQSLPRGTFATKFSGTPKEIHIQAPKRQKNIDTLSTSVGFAAINPVEMPFGFLFIGADAIKGRNRTMAALRYTDGAANLTVYQASVASGSAPWSRESRLKSLKVDEIWVTVDGDLPDEGKKSVLDALKQSAASREAALRDRAASQLGASPELVEKLRDTGLGFGDVVACLAASKGSEKSALESGTLLLEGQGIARLAEKMRVKETGLRAAIKRFWTMRGKDE